MKKVTDMTKFIFVRGMIEPGPFVYIYAHCLVNDQNKLKL